MPDMGHVRTFTVFSANGGKGRYPDHSFIIVTDLGKRLMKR